MTRKYHAVPAEQVLSRFSPERQARINARALEMLAQEVGLGDLRRAKGLTQEQVAKRIGSRQVQVSRLEKRTDVKISTLEKYFAALGAKIEVLAVFPDSGLFRLARIGKGHSGPRSRLGRKPIKAARQAKRAKRSA